MTLVETSPLFKNDNKKRSMSLGIGSLFLSQLKGRDLKPLSERDEGSNEFHFIYLFN